MDNSFGYLDKPKDIVMLKNLLKVGNRNCILVLETENRDWRLQNFELITSFELEMMQIFGRWKFNFEIFVLEGTINFYRRNSMNDNNLRLDLKLQMLMRLYSMHELIDLLDKAGWNYRESYDDIALLKPFTNSEMSI